MGSRSVRAPEDAAAKAEKPRSKGLRKFAKSLSKPLRRAHRRTLDQRAASKERKALRHYGGDVVPDLAEADGSVEDLRPVPSEHRASAEGIEPQAESQTEPKAEPRLKFGSRRRGGGERRENLSALSPGTPPIRRAQRRDPFTPVLTTITMEGEPEADEATEFRRVRVPAAPAGPPPLSTGARMAMHCAAPDSLDKLAEVSVMSEAELHTMVNTHCAVSSQAAPMRENLGKMVTYSGKVSRDMREVRVLARAAREGSLSPSGMRRLGRLLADHREGLAIVQREAGRMMGGLLDGDYGYVPEVADTTRGLSLRLSEMHRELADLTCEFAAATKRSNSPYAAESRHYHNEADVRAGANVAMALSSIMENDGTARGIALDLTKHADNLAKDSDARVRGDFAGLGDWMMGEVSYSADGDPQATPMQKRVALESLRDSWDAIDSAREARGGAPARDQVTREALPERWLPIGHPVLSQREMVEAFIHRRLERTPNARAPNAPNKDRELMAFLFDQGRARVLNRGRCESKRATISFPRAVAGPTSEFVSCHQPAGALVARTHFARRYPEDIVNFSSADRLEHRHVSNLAESVLLGHGEDGSRELVYRGLRHRALDADGLNGRSLSMMPYDQVEGIIKNLAFPRDPDQARRVAEEVERAPRGSPAVEGHARSLRRAASWNMARELGVAALALNRDQFLRAVDGEVPEVTINSIALIAPGPGRKRDSARRLILANQAEALDRLENNGQPMAVVLRDPRNPDNVVNAKARFKVRRFDFAVDAQSQRQPGQSRFGLAAWRRGRAWRFAARANDPALTDLLGPRGTAGVSGAVAVRLRGLSGQITEARRALAGAEMAAAQMRPSEATETLTPLRREVAELESQASAIHQLSEQTKGLWRDRAAKVAGFEPTKMPARLAALSAAMGATPAINCEDGVGRTGLVDADAKYLLAHHRATGSVPPPDVEPDATKREARARFLLEGGGLELERANRAVFGYGIRDMAQLDDLLTPEGARVARAPHAAANTEDSL